MTSKRFAVALFAILTLMLGSACFTCQQLEKDRPYRSGTITRYEDGTLRKAKMAESAAVAGYPVAKNGWVHFYANGVIDGLRLGQDYEIAGRLVPEQTMVWFDEQGAMKTLWLSENRSYDGVPCEGGMLKAATGFYPDGTLRYAFLSEDAEIQGLPCVASVFEQVKFHPNGQLASAKISRDCEYRGKRIRRGDRVHLDEAGDLRL